MACFRAKTGENLFHLYRYLFILLDLATAQLTQQR
jgi:hypothetical protein